jgi:hypothetical protein
MRFSRKYIILLLVEILPDTLHYQFVLLLFILTNSRLYFVSPQKFMILRFYCIHCFVLSLIHCPHSFPLWPICIHVSVLFDILFLMNTDSINAPILYFLTLSHVFTPLLTFYIFCKEICYAVSCPLSQTCTNTSPAATGHNTHEFFLTTGSE